MDFGDFAGREERMGEDFGGNGREIRGERPQTRPFKSAFANQFEPHGKRRDERWGVWWVEDGAGMAVEGQRPGMTAKCPCAADGLLEYAAVTKVDSVEEACGEYYRAF